MQASDAPPTQAPIGLALTRAARVVSRAFDEALTAAGGSLPTWLLLLSAKASGSPIQRELANAVGLRPATLSHHLDALESRGLISRRRDPTDRRTQTVELTEAGEAAFLRMREAAMAFDRRLRAGVDKNEVELLRELLSRVAHNANENATSEREAQR
jgi:MarR family transcriptional regulator for hemolysin